MAGCLIEQPRICSRACGSSEQRSRSAVAVLVRRYLLVGSQLEFAKRAHYWSH